jgi:hypothetical protein
MSADVGSSEAEAARNARLHALCSRPMRFIPAFPLSSGEAETGIKALLSHKVTGARIPGTTTHGIGEPLADVDKLGAPSASHTHEVDRLLAPSIPQNSLLFEGCL